MVESVCMGYIRECAMSISLTWSFPSRRILFSSRSTVVNSFRIEADLNAKLKILFEFKPQIGKYHLHRKLGLTLNNVLRFNFKM